MILNTQLNISWIQCRVFSVVASLCVLGLLTSGHPKGKSKVPDPLFVQNASETKDDVPNSINRDIHWLFKREAVVNFTGFSSLGVDGHTPQETNISRNETNSTDHDSHEGHGGVHVASWRWEYVKTPFIYTTFIIIAGLCKIGYHHADFLSSIIPESCLLIILGTVVGSILYATGSEDLLPQFDSRTFFLFLLPPIVLESAYSLHDRAFFNNLGTILLYAVIGTLLNCFTIGPTLYGLHALGALGENLSLGVLECLVFSALISAVDPVAVLAIFQEVGVHKALYFLVFGESLLNDAVTVVLYTMMVALSTENEITAGQLGLGVASFFCVSLGGLGIGIVMGILTALVTKQTNNVRVVEPLAMLGVAYLAYLLAEMVHFSGIISIIGCGLVQAQYAWCNISQKSYTTVKYFSKMLSAVCDTVIFLFLGMVLVNDHHSFNVGFVLWSTLLCLLFRFIGVLFLTYISNTFDRVRRINFEEQFIMAYGGLRGAVAFSLVIMLDKKTIPNKEMFVTTTLFIILFTVFIQGGTIKPLVNLLKIRLQTGHKHSLFEEINTKVVDSVMAGIEEITGSHGDNYWKQVFLKYDEKYLKKWLQRDCSENVLTRVYTKMVLADHFAHIYGPATGMEELITLPEEHIDEEDILSMTVPARKDRRNSEVPVKQVRFINGDNQMNGIDVAALNTIQESQETPSQESPPPVNNKRRNTLIAPLASLRRRGTTAPPVDDPSKLLQKALQHNPYNKFHLKYNPNLVEDDHQELMMHLQARRLRARRLTLAALNSLGSSTNSSMEDLRQSTASESVHQVPPPITRAMTAPASSFSPYSTTSPINDQTISFLLERAQRRKSVKSLQSRSSKRERLAKSKSEADSVTDSQTQSRSTTTAIDRKKDILLDEERRQNSASSEARVSFGSLDSIEEIPSSPPTLVSDNNATGVGVSKSAAELGAKPKPTKIKKSLTFDVSSIGDSELLDMEEDSTNDQKESKF